MKLRLQANSIRLRLKQSEVAQLIEKNVIEESIRFFPTNDVLTYRIQLSENAAVSSATLKGSDVIVDLPTADARRWASNSTQVGIEVIQPSGAPHENGLTILVEKDFACLDGSDAENADTFPNPLAGTKC